MACDSKGPSPWQVGAVTLVRKIARNRIVRDVPALTAFKFAPTNTLPRSGVSSVMLEILDGPLVFLRRRTAIECAEVASSPGARVGLPRVKAVFAGTELANHGLAFTDDD